MNRFPLFPVVFGFVNEGIAVIHLVQVHRDITRPGMITGRFDVADRAFGRQFRDILSHISLIGTAVLRYMQKAVVCAGPEQSLLNRGFGNGKNRAVIQGTDIVTRNAAGLLLPAFVVGR